MPISKRNKEKVTLLLKDVFASRFEAPECVEILLNYIKNVENPMKEMGNDGFSKLYTNKLN